MPFKNLHSLFSEKIRTKQLKLEDNIFLFIPLHCNVNYQSVYQIFFISSLLLLSWTSLLSFRECLWGFAGTYQKCIMYVFPPKLKNKDLQSQVININFAFCKWRLHIIKYYLGNVCSCNYINIVKFTVPIFLWSVRTVMNMETHYWGTKWGGT